MIKKIKDNKIVIIFFIILFIIGLATYKDYGLGIDEIAELKTTILNYKEYQLVGNDSEDRLDNNFRKLLQEFEMQPRLYNYPYKYYGVAIQLPIMMIDKLFDYQLDVSTIFYIRHFQTFIIFFISLIYLYLLLNKFIFKDKKYSLLGILFLCLSPRIYGDAYSNIKDLSFMCLCIINMYYVFKYIEKSDWKVIIKLSLITALTTNCRVIGISITVFGIIYKILLERNMKKNIFSILKLLGLSYIIYIMVTPASWENPFLFVFKVIDFFFNYVDPYSKEVLYNFYFGKWINVRDVPWHYIPVWIFITTPIIYIVLFFVGFYHQIKTIILKKINYNTLYLNIFLFIMLVFVMITRPILYGGWRHFFFIYPIIIIDGVIGLKLLIEKFPKIKKFVGVIVTINLIAISSWMIKNHPYQYEYFDVTFRDYYIKNFEGNYWKLSNAEALQYIADTDERENIFVYAPANPFCFYLLPETDRKRIELVEYSDDSHEDEICNFNEIGPDYLILNNGSSCNNINYQLIKKQKVDSRTLYSIYKLNWKKNE